MRQMNLSDYCHEIHDMDVDTLIEQSRKLEQDPEAVKRTIDRGADHARAALRPAVRPPVRKSMDAVR